jgi:exodeoxyribonuclease VII large subunit
MSENLFSKGSPEVISVTELTRMIRNLIEGSFGTVWVEGEMSNVRRPASGHCYFTLKDENAQIRALVWRSDMRTMTVEPRDGLLVRASGTLTVYERDGSYQMVVRRMEEGGKGSLQAAFEALKKKLAEEGLFEAARKRALPLLPRTIGIVTSPTGAAIRDILNILKRRFPNLHVVLAPARVQGEGAAVEVAAAIELLDSRGDIDVMIVGRGGGSLEDLWCFNEEIVARAIAASRVPVISAVGHETDFTISDFVADLRAPTPSAAAELVVGRKEEFLEGLSHQSVAMTRLLKHAVLAARSRFAAAANSYVFREPGNAARVYRQRIDRLAEQSRHLLERRFRDRQQRADDLAMRLSHVLKMEFRRKSGDFKVLERQLAAFNPMSVLKRGYSITVTQAGTVVRSPRDVKVGERVETRVSQGRFESQVTKVAGTPSP